MTDADREPRPGRRGLLALASIACTAAALPGCAGSQSAFRDSGPQSSHITSLWWLYFDISAVVYLLVVAFTVAAAARRRARAAQADAQPGSRPATSPALHPAAPPAPETRPNKRRERIAGFVASGAVLLTVVLLLVMLAGEGVVGRSLRAAENTADALDLRITGHRWWWDVEYHDAGPARVIRTANEIHIPTGKPVRFTLSSIDVIHSFWVPNLHGKRDLVPGHPTTLTLQADRPGVYAGQCAEYCGTQHAHMRLVLVAQDPAAYAQWRQAQLSPAPEPATTSQRRGRDIFLSQACVMCHTIGGTSARSRVGPDLTHLASRAYLAGGAIPNTRGHLAGWIVDPQSTKPGVMMPPASIAPVDLHPLLDYLESLK